MSNANALQRILSLNQKRHFLTALCSQVKDATKMIHQNYAFVLQTMLVSNNWLKKRKSSASAEMPLLSNAFALRIRKSKNLLRKSFQNALAQKILQNLADALLIPKSTKN